MASAAKQLRDVTYRTNTQMSTNYLGELMSKEEHKVMRKYRAQKLESGETKPCKLRTLLRRIAGDNTKTRALTFSDQVKDNRSQGS